MSRKRNNSIFMLFYYKHMVPLSIDPRPSPPEIGIVICRKCNGFVCMFTPFASVVHHDHSHSIHPKRIFITYIVVEYNTNCLTFVECVVYVCASWLERKCTICSGLWFFSSVKNHLTSKRNHKLFTRRYRPAWSLWLSSNLKRAESFFAYFRPHIHIHTHTFFLSRFGISRHIFFMISHFFAHWFECISVYVWGFLWVFQFNNFLWHRLIDKSKSKFVSDIKFHWYFCFVPVLFYCSHFDARQNNKFVWIYILIKFEEEQKKIRIENWWNHKCLSNCLISVVFLIFFCSSWLAYSESVWYAHSVDTELLFCEFICSVVYRNYSIIKILNRENQRINRLVLLSYDLNMFERWAR